MTYSACSVCEKICFTTYELDVFDHAALGPVQVYFVGLKYKAALPPYGTIL